MLSYSDRDRIWLIRGKKAKKIKRLVGKGYRHEIHVWQDTDQEKPARSPFDGGRGDTDSGKQEAGAQ